MSSNEIIGKYKKQVNDLESKLSELRFEMKEIQAQLETELIQREYFQLIADFTFGWELWLDPDGKINYCSPSCFDLTGYTSNEILNSQRISDLLLYEPDRIKYSDFLKRSLDQLLVNQSIEFRILTRTKQLRWCIINVRGVYDKLGKYLGIRASIQDITRLKRAMGHIQEMEAHKDLEDRTKQRLQDELKMKDRELVSFLLQLSQKNELLANITGQLKKIQSSNAKVSQKIIIQLLNKMEENSNLSMDWTMIENQLEKLHPGFLERLQILCPTISKKDKILSAYLRLGLSSKEISGLLNITPKSVEIARVRLRKKLNITSKIRLAKFLELV